MWTEGNSGPVYYTYVAAHDGLSVQNWATPIRLDIPAYRIRFLVDSEEVYHLLYSSFYGKQPGVFYTQSIDNGSNWSEPHWLDADIPSSYAPDVIQFEIDDKDGLHAVWYYMELNLGGATGRWVRYAQSIDSGENWSVPLTFDQVNVNGEGPNLPYPGLVIQGKNIHIIWASGDLLYRKHLLSTDSGNSWGETRQIFGELHGQSIGDGLAIDAINRIHFLGVIRWPIALYHAYWDGNQWSLPSIVYLISSSDSNPIGERINAHFIRLAIRDGNQLVGIFTDSPGTINAGLYSVHSTIEDIQSISVEPSPPISPTQMPTTAPPTNSSVVGVDPTLTPIPFDSQRIPSEMTNPGSSLWSGIVPAILLVGSIFIFQFFRKHRKT
jgi:hypothetical protein